MELDKNTADRMARGSKKKNNVVFGQLNGKAEYHSFGKFKVSFKGRENTDKELGLDKVIQLLFDEITEIREQNKRLHRMIKVVAKDLNDYKRKVGIR